MLEQPDSYLSPKLEGRILPDKGGQAVYALEPITKGETLVVWGGQILNREQLNALPPSQNEHSVQVEEGRYLMPRIVGPADWVNHSCDPNAGMMGQIVLVAMRDIASGEEVCYDYAMSDGSDYDEFPCACEGPHCRTQITGEDWRLPEIQARYAGYFSPYLQRRIDQLASQNE